LGVVIGLAVGFGYRFWSTRREELMAATVAATLLRDAARAAEHKSDDATNLADMWEEQRVALLRLITPADYELLSRAVETAGGNTGLVPVLDRLTNLFWREHQAFILTPLIKYARRDDLSGKVSEIVRGLAGRDELCRGGQSASP
jgi:hypothetical protein